MHKSLRYLILLIGFIIFISLAPFIVMYVKGVKFSEEQQKYISTGIFAVKTDPKDADIFLDGKLQAKSPANIRFLEPKEYDISISKPGYLTWKKRLELNEGKVTWINPNPANITLFLANPVSQIISDQTEDFLLTRDAIITYRENILTVIPYNQNQAISNKTFSGTILGVTLNEDLNTAYINTAAKEYLLSLTTNTLLEFSRPKPQELITPLSYPNVLIHSGNESFIFNAKTSQTIKLWQDTISISVSAGSIYALVGSSASSSLITTQLDNPQNQETLLSNPPLFKQATLIPTRQKLLFIIGDNNLYRVGFNLEPIAQQIETYHYDPLDGSLIYSTPGELAYYSFSESQSKLITRSTEPFSSVIIRSDLAHSFYINGSKAAIIELDNRGGQNVYTATSGQALKKIALSPDGKILFVLNGKQLSSFIIR